MHHPPVTFYIHHDGYPEGAAVYLWNMHHQSQNDGTPAGKFYRANERAEFTDGHDAHGDTEFRYTLRGSMLTAHKRYSGADACSWSAFYVGEYHEFVNQYGRGSFDEFSPLRAVPTVYGWRSNETRVYSRQQITEGLEKARAEHASYVERFPTYTGNISGLANTVAAWERALADYNAQEEFDNAKPAKA
jgi:hypothetical protein